MVFNNVVKSNLQQDSWNCVLLRGIFFFYFLCAEPTNSPRLCPLALLRGICVAAFPSRSPHLPHNARPNLPAPAADQFHLAKPYRRRWADSAKFSRRSPVLIFEPASVAGKGRFSMGAERQGHGLRAPISRSNSRDERLRANAVQNLSCHR